MCYQVAGSYEADVGHAYLTVISTSNVKFHQGEYYGNKSGYAHSRVDLSIEID